MRADTSQLRSLSAACNNASGRIGSASAAVVRKSAAAIERGAKSRAPVRTGELKADIVSTTLTGDGRFSAMSAEIASTSDHGAYVEQGTSVMAPEPYLAPAFDAEVPNFERGIRAAGAKVL